MSASLTAAAAVMRGLCALPCTSATTRYGSPASGSAASSIAPPPLDSTKRPRSPRALATRSGQAWSRSTPGRGLSAPRSGDRPARRAWPAPADPQAAAPPPRAATSPSRKRSSRRSRSALSPPRPRSVMSTASSAASRACAGPRRLRHHMRQPHRQSEPAHRRCPPRSAGRRRRCASRAASSVRASASAAAGGGSRNASARGSATPKAAQSSKSDDRSASRISGVL